MIEYDAERSEELERMAESLYAACAPLNRGDVLPHEVIEPILGIPPNVGHWQHVVNKVRRRLRDERGIATWPVKPYGYKLCTVEEQAKDVPMMRHLKARRQCRRGLREVRALPDDGLSLHQRQMKAHSIAQLKRSYREVNAQLREDRVIFRRPETLPRHRPALRPA